jgi:hypothetical protein
MRSIATVTVAILLLLGSAAGAQQSPPSPRIPQPKALNPQKQSPAPQGDQGTAAPPAVPVQKVETAPLNPTNNPLNDEKKEELQIERQAVEAGNKTAAATENLANAANQLVVSGDRLVTATNALGGFAHGLVLVGGALVIVLLIQIGMFVRQLDLIKKGATHAKLAADAAGKSADLAKFAFTKLERAFIACGGNALNDRRMFKLVVHNGGKTPGEITRIGMGWCVAGNPPSEPDYTDLRFVAWIPPGVRDHPLTIIEINKIRGAEPPPGVDINIYGRIHYNDIFGEPHSFGFFITARASGENFVTPNPPRAYVTWD